MRYKPTATRAFELVIATLAQAIADLPDSVRRHYAIAKNHSPDPWEDTKHWYGGQADAMPDTLELLGHICLLHRARLALQALLMPTLTQPPNLSLPRTRRTP